MRSSAWKGGVVSQSPEEFHASLPRKRMGAGVVFINARQQVLLVNPTYKPTWELPGGAVEHDESPRDAARREVGEELGLNIDVGPMICIDYNETTDGYLESLMFLFSAPPLTALTRGDDSTPSRGAFGVALV